MYVVLSLKDFVTLDDGELYSAVACIAEHLTVDKVEQLVAVPTLLIRYDQVIAAQYTDYVDGSIPILSV